MPINKRHTALQDAISTAKAFALMFADLTNTDVKLKNSNKNYDSDFNDEKKLNDSPIR